MWLVKLMTDSWTSQIIFSVADWASCNAMSFHAIPCLLCALWICDKLTTERVTAFLIVSLLQAGMVCALSLFSTLAYILHWHGSPHFTHWPTWWLAIISIKVLVNLSAGLTLPLLQVCSLSWAHGSWASYSMIWFWAVVVGFVSWL